MVVVCTAGATVARASGNVGGEIFNNVVSGVFLLALLWDVIASMLGKDPTTKILKASEKNMEALLRANSENTDKILKAGERSNELLLNAIKDSGDRTLAAIRESNATILEAIKPLKS